MTKPVWIKDTTELEESDKYDIREKHYVFFLTIYNIEQADEGRYSCYLENYVGSTSDSVLLKGASRNPFNSFALYLIILEHNRQQVHVHVFSRLFQQVHHDS